MVNDELEKRAERIHASLQNSIAGGPMERCVCHWGFTYINTIHPPAHGFTNDVYQVQCKGCGICGPWDLTANGAVAKWDEFRRKTEGKPK